MMHNNLIAYYERVFAFKQYHGWSMSEIEELMPWELDVMTNFLNNYLELQEMKRKQALANR
tara:strand:+ start:161 stop:343 length:183 start_codon:yes stop_codon:yes gene_type:complete